MEAYLQDVSLMFKRVHGTKPVVVHVEPDLWGYIEQSGDVALGAAFAQQWVSLRNSLAPNVILAYHMSGWGTKHDIVFEDPSDATVRAYATASATFYRALHAKFDISFEDFSDRDAGFYAKINGNPNTLFTPADFHRHLLYGATFVKLAGIRMAAWQIPLGNNLMRASDNTWGHFQDNRVEWLLGSASSAHLRAYANAGYVGFLFGGGANGTTCACDGQKDGVTNPEPIGDNTRVSLSADDDGGYFRLRASAYYASGGLTTGTGPNPPPPPPPVAKWTSSGSAKPTSLVRGHSIAFKINVKPSVTVRARVQVDVYDSAGHRVYTHRYGFHTFLAGALVTYKPGFKTSTSARAGTYKVRIVILSTTGGWLSSNPKLTTFKVRTK
jgi:hypothetical protein